MNDQNDLGIARNDRFHYAYIPCSYLSTNSDDDKRDIDSVHAHGIPRRKEYEDVRGKFRFHLNRMNCGIIYKYSHVCLSLHRSCTSKYILSSMFGNSRRILCTSFQTHQYMHSSSYRANNARMSILLHSITRIACRSSSSFRIPHSAILWIVLL